MNKGIEPEHADAQSKLEIFIAVASYTAAKIAPENSVENRIKHVKNWDVKKIYQTQH